MFGRLSSFRTVRTDAVELLYSFDPQGGMVAPLDYLKQDSEGREQEGQLQIRFELSWFPTEKIKIRPDTEIYTNAEPVLYKYRKNT